MAEREGSASEVGSPCSPCPRDLVQSLQAPGRRINNAARAATNGAVWERMKGKLSVAILGLWNPLDCWSVNSASLCSHLDVVLSAAQINGLSGMQLCGPMVSQTTALG